MKYCVKCGHQLADDAVICTGCGQIAPSPTYPDYSDESFSAGAEAAPSAEQATPPAEGMSYSSANQGNVAPREEYAGPYDKAIKILMIVETVIRGIYLLPLLWCIPLTISVRKRMREGRPFTIGFIVLLFFLVSPISSILLYLRDR